MSASPSVLWQCPPKTVLVGMDFGGSLIEGGPVTQCEADVMQRASLVGMATRSDRPSSGITDAVAKVLGACQRPVLSFRQVEHIEEGAS